MLAVLALAFSIFTLIVRCAVAAEQHRPAHCGGFAVRDCGSRRGTAAVGSEPPSRHVRVAPAIAAVSLVIQLPCTTSRSRPRSVNMSTFGCCP